MGIILKNFLVTTINGAQYCFMYRMLRPHNSRIVIRLYATNLNSAEYMNCYNILNVKVNSDQETVRQAFLQLVKKYHPDSGSTDADAQKFQQIERAYRKLQEKFHAERWMDRKNDGAGEYGLYYQEKKVNDETPVVQLDIKHTAPQHRQYLSYDGVGVGTPAQRQKQYQKLRASSAVENVYNHRISKIQQAQTLNDEQALIVKDKQRAKNIKTRYGMDRLVEDLIQESMAKGEFDNLSGKGKPLSTRQDHFNPYVDLVTHKVNQVMIDNGFMPEWISLQKEIREDVQRLREQIQRFRDSKHFDCENHWERTLDIFKSDVQALNSKIGKYNLIVPLLPNQMLLFDLEKEAKKIFSEGPVRCEESDIKSVPAERRDDSVFGTILSLFSR